MENRISDYTDKILSPRTSEDGLAVFTSLRDASGSYFTPAADDRFIRLSDLDTAIHEACEEYELCEGGRDDMRRSLGIIPNVVDYTQKIRVDDLHIRFTGPPGANVEGLISASDIDRTIYRALEELLQDRARELPDRNLSEFDVRADCYFDDPELDDE